MGITLKLKSENVDEITLSGNDFFLESYKPTVSDLNETVGSIDEFQNISEVKYQTMKIKIGLTIKANLETNKNAISAFLRKAISNTNKDSGEKYYLSYKEDTNGTEKQTRIYSGTFVVSDNYLRYEKAGGLMKMMINLTCSSVWEATSVSAVTIKNVHNAGTTNYIQVDNVQKVTGSKNNFVEIDKTGADFSFDSLPVLNVVNNNVADAILKKIVVYKKTRNISADMTSDYDSSIKLVSGDFTGFGGTVSTVTDAKYLGGSAIQYAWTGGNIFTVFRKHLQTTNNENFRGESYKLFLAIDPSTKAINKQTRFRVKYSGYNGLSSSTEWFYLENSNYHFSTILKVGQKGVAEDDFSITLEAQCSDGDTLVFDYFELVPCEQILEVSSFISSYGINDGTIDLSKGQVYRNIDGSTFKNSYYTIKGNLTISPNVKQRFYFVCYWFGITGDNSLGSYKRAQYSVNVKVEEMKRYLV